MTAIPDETAGNLPQQILDEGVLSRIDSLDDSGTGQLLTKLLEIFSQTKQNCLAGIRTALESGDEKARQQAAHALKSSCVNLGAVRAAAVCRKIEKGGLNATEMNQALFSLETELAAATESLTRRLRPNSDR